MAVKNHVGAIVPTPEQTEQYMGMAKGGRRRHPALGNDPRASR